MNPQQEFAAHQTRRQFFGRSATGIGAAALASLNDQTRQEFNFDAEVREAVEQIRSTLGLDRPLYEQFIRYVGDLVHGGPGQLPSRVLGVSPGS